MCCSCDVHVEDHLVLYAFLPETVLLHVSRAVCAEVCSTPILQGVLSSAFRNRFGAV